MADRHLIIFVKNPIPGTVKTRVARSVGHERATQVYRHLLLYTQQMTHALPYKRIIYYGDFVNPDDGWNPAEKRLQVGKDLGERMANALREQFDAHAGQVPAAWDSPAQVVIIGSDCLTLTADHIRRAFEVLDTTDVVIGPATDGGYYLLGMKRLHSCLFENMPWSQPELRQRTEQVIVQNELTFEQLDELTDIDEWTDYENALT